VARPIVLSLTEYNKLTGSQISKSYPPSNTEDKVTDIDSPAKPNALFQQQRIDKAKEEDYVDYEDDDAECMTCMEDNEGENQSINSKLLEHALEVNSSLENDTPTTKHEPHQTQGRSDQSTDSGSDVSSNESDKDSAAERHKKQSEKRIQSPEAEAKEALRCSQRVAKLGKQINTGQTTASQKKKPKKSVSDISDESDSESELD
jgi:hypothetical protein